jgi:hypothetical protein
MAWNELVQNQLQELLPASGVAVVLAGVLYREGVVPFLKSNGFKIEIPMEGKKYGQQLRWLKENT